MVTEAVEEQPLLSVMLNVYVPAVRVKLPVPVYGEVPPLAVTVTVVEPPKQAMLPAEAEADNAEGCVMVTEEEALQPAASVTVKE